MQEDESLNSVHLLIPHLVSSIILVLHNLVNLFLSTAQSDHSGPSYSSGPILARRAKGSSIPSYSEQYTLTQAKRSQTQTIYSFFVYSPRSREHFLHI